MRISILLASMLFLAFYLFFGWMSVVEIYQDYGMAASLMSVLCLFAIMKLIVTPAIKFSVEWSKTKES